MIDSDTILKDIMDESDFEFSGISLDIFEIYKGSRDKKALRQMLFEFAGIEFGEYLNRCLMETTRWSKNFEGRNSMEILEERDDMKTITVEIEIYDDSTVEEVETALEFGLNDVGINCTYYIKEIKW